MSLFDSGLLPNKEATREFFFNIGGDHSFMRAGVFLIAFAAFIYFISSLVKRVRVWKMGMPEARNDYPEKRIAMVVKYVFMQRRILKNRFAGVMHLSVFAGFIILFLVTTLIFVQEDFTKLLFRHTFINGNFYIIMSLAADMAGVAIILGLFMASYRRYVSKPTGMDNDRGNGSFLLLLLAVILSGFFSEAMRIALTGFPEFESLASPVGYRLAYLFAFFEDKTLMNLHYYNWFLHLALAFTFIAHLAVGKTGHIVISFLNIYFGNLENESSVTKNRTANLNEKGVCGVEQFTWKNLMDADACIGCGRCQDVCPAFLTEKPLSPKKIVQAVAENMQEKFSNSRNGINISGTPLVSNASGEVGSVRPDEIWACTNCGACVDACPIGIEQMPMINDMRRGLVSASSPSADILKKPFENMAFYKNANGFPLSERGAWAQGLSGISKLSENSETDFLFFAGCSVSYNERSARSAKAFINICSSAGLTAGMLWEEESCCGDFALRSGNVELFRTLALKNIESFRKYGVKKIVTMCPHGYNVMKKEYSRFFEGEGFELLHHSEMIGSLIADGKITVSRETAEKITFHDPCFLGRYNGIYEVPRNIIGNLPGKTLLETSRHGENSLCCGSGGGRVLFGEETGISISGFRARELRGSGGERICTACPHCLNGLEDGIRSERIDNFTVADIAEIVWESME